MSAGESQKIAAISFAESYRLLLRACKITVLLCASPLAWAGWWTLTDTANPPVLQWVTPLVAEGCSFYVILLWSGLGAAPRRLRAYGWVLLGLNGLALLAGQSPAMRHDHELAALGLSLACVTLFPVLILTVLARDVALRQFEMEEAERLGLTAEAQMRHLVGDIGPDAGNALTGTAVYRFFDVTRRSIYTGKSRDFLTRFKDHRAKKPWFADVHHMSVVWYRDEAAALAAEERAIKTEGPLHNVIHNQNRSSNGRN